MLVAQRRDVTYFSAGGGAVRLPLAAALNLLLVLFLLLILEHSCPAESFAPLTSFVPTPPIRIQTSPSPLQHNKFWRPHHHCHGRRRHPFTSSSIAVTQLPEPGMMIIADISSASGSVMTATAATLPVVAALLGLAQQQQLRNTLLDQQNVTATELEQFQRRARGQDLRAKVNR